MRYSLGVMPPNLSSHPRVAFMTGVAVWAPRLPGWSIAAPVLRGEAEPPAQIATRPAPPYLAPTERRRAPDTVVIALEVANSACQGAGVDPRAVASVFASTHGDLVISDYMSDTLAKTPSLVSPIRFHNSVHNAAAGYWSIGTGGMKPYTALTAWGDTFGEGLLEALVQADTEGDPTLLVAYDIEARGALAQMQPSRGMLGVGIVVTAQPVSDPIAMIRWRTVSGEEPTAPSARNAGLIEGNAMAACLPLLEAVAIERSTRVIVSLSSSLMLELDLDFEGIQNA